MPPRIDPKLKKANQAAYRRKKMQQNRAVVYALKEASPCLDCGKKYPHYVMHYDHLRDKMGDLAHMVQRESLTRILAEIEKCELVCANCHAIRTHVRRIKKV